MINREFIDGTLKSNLIIPISFPKLKLTKIIVTGLATVMFCFVSLVCSFVFSIILHYPMNMGDISIAAKKILITGMCCYIAVIPIILLFTAKRNSFLAGGTCGVCIWILRNFCGRYRLNELVSYDNGANNHII